MGIFRRAQEAGSSEQQPQAVHQTFEPTVEQPEVRDFSEFLDENHEALTIWNQSWDQVTSIVDEHLHNPLRLAEYKTLIEERLDYQQETIQMKNGDELRSRSRRFAVKDAFKKDLPLRITRGVIGAKLLTQPETATRYEVYERSLDSGIEFNLFDEDGMDTGISAGRSVSRNVETELVPYLSTAQTKEAQIMQQLETYLFENYSNFAGFMEWIVDAPAAGGTEESPLLQILAKQLDQGTLDDLISPALERYEQHINQGIEHDLLSNILDPTNPNQHMSQWIRFAAGDSDPISFMLQRTDVWPQELQIHLEADRGRVLDEMSDAISHGITKYQRRIHQPATMQQLERIDQLIMRTQDVNESKKSSRKSGATNMPKVAEFTDHIDVKEPEVIKHHRVGYAVKNEQGTYDIVQNGEAQKIIEEKIDRFIRDVNGSAKMADDIRRMIQHVVHEPIGRGKNKYSEHTLRISDKPQPLSLRRINPVKTPGLSIAEESRPVRVIYAFDNKGHNGKSVVVIEGIYAHGRGYEARIG